MKQIDLYISGSEGYHTYRIPALLLSKKGTVLAFCEGRKTGRGDTGDIDMLVRRSEDGGKSWGKQQVIWNDTVAYHDNQKSRKTSRVYYIG